MEWIRTWVLQIAGIIVLGALCDMIMPDSEMKKYVKMVIGLILAFAVLKPIVNISTDTLNIDVPKDPHSEAVELRNKLDEMERKKIISLYCKNLEEKIVDEVKESCDGEIWIDVKVEENDDKQFGNITEVQIVCENLAEGADVNKIKDTIQQKFGVNAESVKIRVN